MVMPPLSTDMGLRREDAGSLEPVMIEGKDYRYSPGHNSLESAKKQCAAYGSKFVCNP